jgi:LIM domain
VPLCPVRLPQRGLALFCKPHFRQNFMDSGGRYTVADASTSKEAAPAPAPAYKPSCVTLFSDDEADHTPAASLVVRKTPQKPAASFDSGFEPEYKLGEAKPLQTKGCAKCGAKVFPICKLELPDGSGIYHVDCFRCSVCSVHLRVGSYEASEDGSLRCMKHVLTAKKA